MKYIIEEWVCGWAVLANDVDRSLAGLYSNLAEANRVCDYLNRVEEDDQAEDELERARR